MRTEKSLIDTASGLAAQARVLVREGRTIDLGAAEAPEAHELRMAAVSRATTLVAETIALLTEACTSFEDDDRDEIRVVADVAAIARMTLREKEQFLLRTAPDTDAWEIVDRCDRAIRSVGKAALALEQALAAAFGIDMEIDLLEEPAIGLRVRAAYAKFRLAVRLISEREAPLDSRIRAGATALAILTGREEYTLMRALDRQQLRNLQLRCRAWLASESLTPSEGEHVWQELLAVSDLIMQVSKRAALVEHDDSVLRETCSILGNGAASIEDVWPNVVSLRGLDLALDRLIEEPHGIRTSVWTDHLSRVAAERFGHVPVDAQPASNLNSLILGLSLPTLAWG